MTGVLKALSTALNSHISTSMYLVYRRDRSSDTYHLKDLEDMVIKTLRVDVSMFIYCLITGVITEYKTEIWGGKPEFSQRDTQVLHFGQCNLWEYFIKVYLGNGFVF